MTSAAPARSSTEASSSTAYAPLARGLAPREPALDVLVRPVDVGGRVAYQDLVRSRALVEVWDDVAAPATVPRTATLRALAVRELVPPRTVLGGDAAAWVLCGGPRPRTLSVLYPPGTHRPAPLPGRTPRQAAVLRTETELVAGVRVTGVQRTALDVATRAEHDAAVATLRRLRDALGLDVALAARSLELRYRWPGRDRARSVFAVLLADACGAG